MQIINHYTYCNKDLTNINQTKNAFIVLSALLQNNNMENINLLSTLFEIIKNNKQEDINEDYLKIDKHYQNSTLNIIETNISETIEKILFSQKDFQTFKTLFHSFEKAGIDFFKIHNIYQTTIAYDEETKNKNMTEALKNKSKYKTNHFFSKLFLENNEEKNFEKSRYIIDYFIKTNPKKLIETINQSTLMHNIVKKSDVEYLQKIVDLGADINVKEPITEIPPIFNLRTIRMTEKLLSFKPNIEGISEKLVEILSKENTKDLNGETKTAIINLILTNPNQKSKIYNLKDYIPDIQSFISTITNIMSKNGTVNLRKLISNIFPENYEVKIGKQELSIPMVLFNQNMPENKLFLNNTTINQTDVFGGNLIYHMIATSDVQLEYQSTLEKIGKKTINSNNEPIDLYLINKLLVNNNTKTRNTIPAINNSRYVYTNQYSKDIIKSIFRKWGIDIEELNSSKNLKENELVSAPINFLIKNIIKRTGKINLDMEKIIDVSIETMREKNNFTLAQPYKLQNIIKYLHSLQDLSDITTERKKELEQILSDKLVNLYKDHLKTSTSVDDVIYESTSVLVKGQERFYNFFTHKTITDHIDYFVKIKSSLTDIAQKEINFIYLNQQVKTKSHTKQKLKI